VTPAVEQELRRLLDGAIGRALVDRDYEAELLARPQVTLGSPELDSEYTTLRELAQHMLRLFWPAQSPRTMQRHYR
jgi:hypothetical protein